MDSFASKMSQNWNILVHFCVSVKHFEYLCLIGTIK